jgi:hypothetical protein
MDPDVSKDNTKLGSTEPFWVIRGVCDIVIACADCQVVTEKSAKATDREKPRVWRVNMFNDSLRMVNLMFFSSI